MRRIVAITPARLANRSMPHAKGLYGPTFYDLTRFIAVKFRLDTGSARAIIHDVFRYIDGEVMRNDQFVSVPGFGTIRKREAEPQTRHGVVIRERQWMAVDRVERRSRGTLYTDVDDPEDAGTGDEYE